VESKKNSEKKEDKTSAISEELKKMQKNDRNK
jgi:hypothetical protein